MDFLSGLFGDGGSSGSSGPVNEPAQIDESTNTLINFGSGSQGISAPQTLTSNQPDNATGGGGSSSGSSGGFGSIMSIIGIVAALI